MDSEIPTQPPSVKLTWNDVDRIHRNLAAIISAENFAPEFIVAISRGGLVTATHLAYLLSVKNIISISIRRPILKSTVEHSLSFPEYIGQAGDIDLLNGQRVLIVDGAIGTGRTIRKAVSVVSSCNPKEIRVAIMATWADCPGSKNALADCTSRYYLGETYYPWPIFPWEN